MGNLITGLSPDISTLEQKIQSTVKTITLLASGWQGNQYTINDSLVTLTSNQMVGRGLTMTEEQTNAYYEAKLSEVGQSSGQMVIKASGTVPTIDIPIRVMFSMTLLESPRASDKVTLSTRNDTGDSIKFGIDKDGNYGYIKAGADSVVPFRRGTIGAITGGNNVPSQTISNLVVGEIYVGTLFTTDQTLPSNLFTEGAKLIDSRYVSYAGAQGTWYAHFVVFEATATISKMYKTLYLAYAKVE